MERKVALLMGSDSDLPVVQKAIDTLAALGIPYEAHVMSAHRTPAHVVQFAASARENGFGALIAAAGMAAHLAGVVAAHTTLPVIGIPCSGGAAGGLDALLATVQMPPGIPVATVGMDAGVNAALLAAGILAVEDTRIAGALGRRRAEAEEAITQKDAALQEALASHISG